MDISDQSTASRAVHVRAFGALGDGTARDTAAIQAAIDACHAQGGGTVFIPAGVYLTGALTLRSNITLHLDAGATLLGSEDPNDYPIISSRWEGAEQPTHAPLIGGRGLENIAIVGRGTIDGRGAIWWLRFRSRALAHPRPRLVAFDDCRNLLISGITALNSPSWTINPVRCKIVNIHQVTIVNPADSPNTDGINPDSCSDVHISDCYISVGDDCITIKSGTERERAERLAPCQNITITNCTMANGHGGVVIGSEMSGDVRNVVISNCVFVGTDRGIRFKSRRGRGGTVEDVRVTNVVMTDVLCPLTMNLYYACGAWGDATVSDRSPRPVTTRTPRFRRITLSHITATGAATAAAFLYGLAEMPLEDIALEDVSISMAGAAEPGYPDMADGLELMQGAGLIVCNARGLRLHRVEVRGQRGPAIQISSSSEVDLSACCTPTPAPDAPVLLLRDVDGAFIHNCKAYRGTEVFAQLVGAGTRDVVLEGNHLLRARQPVRSDGAAQPDTFAPRPVALDARRSTAGEEAGA
jgi:polygalacturonase